MHENFHNNEPFLAVEKWKQTQIAMKNFEPFVTKLETNMWCIVIDFHS